ncbi:MAG: 30S ribosomal protein S13 [Candidatus Aenigmarchaeota archaeon]|nr:30S ribosomal protein S13 [Candidatus Aenigmarchaeota archaeon]
MGSGKPKKLEKEQAVTKAVEKVKPTEVKKKIVPAGVRGIVRIAEVDLDGTKKLHQALLKIKGIGHAMALAVPKAAGIDGNVLAGSLTDDQLEQLEAVIAEPTKFGIPAHLVNRMADPVTGENKHLVSSELSITIKSDIDQMKKIRCYKGVRHELGLPVRGQRTRSSFRTGMTAGVTRAKAAATAAPAKAAPSPGAAKVAATTPATPGAKPAAKPETKPEPIAAKAKEEKK